MSAEKSYGRGYELCLHPHYAWVQRLFSTIPGASGYLRREKLREADVLVRRHVASRVSEAERLLREAAGLVTQGFTSLYFASTPTLTPRLPAPVAAAPVDLPQRLMDAANRLNRLSADILYADAGWAPVSAVQAIREEEILRLCEFDDTMIGLGEVLLEAARRVADAVRRSDYQEANQRLQDVLDAASRLEETLRARAEYLRFAGSGEKPVTSYQDVIGMARSALSKLAEKLGLRRG